MCCGSLRLLVKRSRRQSSSAAVVSHPIDTIQKDAPSENGEIESSNVDGIKHLFQPDPSSPRAGSEPRLGSPEFVGFGLSPVRETANGEAELSIERASSPASAGQEATEYFPALESTEPQEGSPELVHETTEQARQTTQLQEGSLHENTEQIQEKKERGRSESMSSLDRVLREFSFERDRSSSVPGPLVGGGSARSFNSSSGNKPSSSAAGLASTDNLDPSE